MPIKQSIRIRLSFARTNGLIVRYVSVRKHRHRQDRSSKFGLCKCFVLFGMVQIGIGLLLSTPLHAGPNVAVSIAPVHALLAGVMDGVETPKLLIPLGQSPHDYALIPSVVKQVYNADLVVWIGSDYETALSGVIAQVGKNSVIKALGSLREFKTYPLRTGTSGEADSTHRHKTSNQADHQDNPEQHQEWQAGDVDPHFWLSTFNAKMMVRLFRIWLTEIDAKNAQIYARNSEYLIMRINTLQRNLQQQLKVVTSPYMVFHDAYQYFEKEFNLNSLGSITLNPQAPLGVKRIQALRKTIIANGVKCLFSEPQFKSKQIPTLIENTGVRLAELDPLGTYSQTDTELWFDVMTTMSQSLIDCHKNSH